MLRFKSFVGSILVIPTVTEQSTIFQFLDIEYIEYITFNHLLFIFKYYVYISRNQHKITFGVL